MKPFIQVIAVGLACCLGSAAQAAIVTYTYQAKVGSISEKANPNAGFVDVTRSTIAGTPVAIGDILTGSFQYDTSVGLYRFQPSQQPGAEDRMYNSGASDYISYVDKNTGLAFSSLTSQNWLGSNQVRNGVPGSGASAYDVFSMMRNAVNGVTSATVDLRLYNFNGDALQSAAMPTELSLAAFQYASIESSFLRLSDNASLYLSASITSLEHVDIPEPGTALLFAIAGSGLFGLRRMRRS